MDSFFIEQLLDYNPKKLASDDGRVRIYNYTVPIDLGAVMIFHILPLMTEEASPEDVKNITSSTIITVVV